MSNRYTRRSALLTIGGVFAASSPRLAAFGGNFWDKKEPAEWSSEEVRQISTKSPWAKEVSGQAPAQDGHGGGYNGGGYGGGGGGMGRGGMGGGRNRGGMGMPMQNMKGTIRWESAAPIRQALKDTIPAAFDGHYVIAVAGFQLNEYGARRRGQTQNPESDEATQDMLDHLKGVTFLQPKDKRDIQPGVVQKAVSGDLAAVFFGFSKEALTLTVDDKECGFITQFGRLELKTRFNLKDMVYRGELAV